MESGEVVARVSGIRWALFCYDALNEPCNSEGLLLGTETKRESRVVTDSDPTHVKIETIFQVNAMIPTGVQYSFYDQMFELDKAMITNVQETHSAEGKVIGWYKFRRGVQHHRTTHMEDVTEKLKGTMIPGCQSPSILLYLTHRETDIRSPFSYQFDMLTDLCCYKGIKLNVINMGDTSDEDKYWPSTSASSYGDWIDDSLPETITQGAGVGRQSCLATLERAAEALIQAENRHLEMQEKNYDGCAETRTQGSLKRKWWEDPSEENGKQDEKNIKSRMSLEQDGTDTDSGGAIDGDNFDGCGLLENMDGDAFMDPPVEGKDITGQ